MNALHSLGLALPLLGISLMPAAQQTAPSGLIRIQPQRADAAPFSTEEWRAKLSSPDLDRREQDFAALAQRVRRDPAVRAEVEKWAREGDGELAWTARLLLRDTSGSNAAVTGMFGSPQSLWFHSPDDVERLFEVQPFGLDPFVWGDDGEAQSLFVHPLTPQSGAQNGVQSQSQRFQMKSGPDGVHVTVEEDADGDTVKKEYSAESLDKLFEENPELRGKLGGLGADGIGGLGGLGALGALGGLGGNHGLTFRLGGSVDAPKPRTDVLGVSVRPLPKDDAKSLGVDAGVGLLVERVEPKSIAAALGIQRGHVLVEMNGHELHAAQDITDQLCSRPADGEIQVELVDRWGQRRTRSWKPDAAADAPAPKSAANDLRKI